MQPEKVSHKAAMMKPKLQWRPQDVGDARNVDPLLRKASGKEWNQP
jgi:hypothetical protein